MNERQKLFMKTEMNKALRLSKVCKCPECLAVAGEVKGRYLKEKDCPLAEYPEGFHTRDKRTVEA